MKRILVLLAAVCTLALVSEPKADARVSFSFGFGVPGPVYYGPYPYYPYYYGPGYGYYGYYRPHYWHRRYGYYHGYHRWHHW
jgi:hypothetical protein